MSEDSKAAYHALRKPAEAWVHTSPDELRKYQAEHKVSQTGLARHLHANSEALKKWLDGSKIPSLVLQARFKEALGTKPEAASARSKPARSKPAASTKAARPTPSASVTRPGPSNSTKAARPSTSAKAARPKLSASAKATRPKPSASAKATRLKPAAATKGTRRGGRKPGTWVLLQKDAVAQYRKDAKLSRPKLAELLGVSPTSIQNWETGHSVPIERFQQRLLELMKGNPPTATRREVPAAAAKAGAPRRGRGSTTSPGASRSADVAPLQLQVTRLTVVGEILKGYLSTAQGGKVSPEQLVKLATSLRGALA